MTGHTARTAHGERVRDFNHAELARLPAYQALRQALSDISTQAAASAHPVTVAGFLEAVQDMALTAPYGDCCPRCGSEVGGLSWPHAGSRKGGYLTGEYQCARGHVWPCTYLADLPAYM